MGGIEELGVWIAANETLLSGIAAIIAVAGVIISPIVMYANRRRPKQSPDRERSPAAKTEAEPGAPRPKRLSYQDLVVPAPYPIQFAQAQGGRIAYAQLGEGEPPIFLTPGVVSHLHVLANLPTFHRLTMELTKIGQLTVYDKRGQGLSDPVMAAQSLAERCADLGLVMDAAGLDSAVLFGISEGGPMSIQYAIDNPDRVRGLILGGTTARWLQSEDYPIGIPGEDLDMVKKVWGHGQLRDVFFPSLSREMMDDETFCAMERLLASRQSIENIVEFLKTTDVRELLPRLQVPTLVVHFTGDLSMPVRMGRALAEAIPGARFLEVAGSDHADFSTSPEAMQAIREFCEGLN